MNANQEQRYHEQDFRRFLSDERQYYGPVSVAEECATKVDEDKTCADAQPMVMEINKATSCT